MTAEMVSPLGVGMSYCDEHQRAGSWTGHKALAYKLKGELYQRVLGALAGEGRVPTPSQAILAFRRWQPPVSRP